MRPSLKRPLNADDDFTRLDQPHLPLASHLINRELSDCGQVDFSLAIRLSCVKMSGVHPLRLWNPQGDIERTPLSLWWQVPRHFDDEELNQTLEQDSLRSFEALVEYCKDSFDLHMRSEQAIAAAKAAAIEGKLL